LERLISKLNYIKIQTVIHEFSAENKLKKQETGENYIGSFVTCTQQICVSLIEAGRARYICGEEKYIKGFEVERNETPTKAWA